MKLIRILLISLLTMQLAHGQNTQTRKLINNDEIEFTVLMTMPDFEHGTFISDYLIQLVSLNIENQQVAKKWNKRQWMTLLKNKQTDWAANIVLYSLYKKRAWAFWHVVRNRAQWSATIKDEDIKYWRIFLKD